MHLLTMYLCLPWDLVLTERVTPGTRETWHLLQIEIFISLGSLTLFACAILRTSSLILDDLS
jgi:hypothetical protein